MHCCKAMGVRGVIWDLGFGHNPKIPKPHTGTLNSKTLQPKPWNSEESWQLWAQGAALQDAFIRVRIRGGLGDINPFKRARSRVKKGPL